MSRRSQLAPRVRRAFASVLKDARFESVLTQERLAEFADLDRTTPSLLERALRQPTLTTIILVGWALLVDPPELVQRVMDRLKRMDRRTRRARNIKHRGPQNIRKR